MHRVSETLLGKLDPELLAALDLELRKGRQCVQGVQWREVLHKAEAFVLGGVVHHAPHINDGSRAADDRFDHLHVPVVRDRPHVEHTRRVRHAIVLLVLFLLLCCRPGRL